MNWDTNCLSQLQLAMIWWKLESVSIWTNILIIYLFQIIELYIEVFNNFWMEIILHLKKSRSHIYKILLIILSLMIQIQQIFISYLASASVRKELSLKIKMQSLKISIRKEMNKIIRQNDLVWKKLSLLINLSSVKINLRCKFYQV